jgi:predicted transcriptional regulator
MPDQQISPEAPDRAKNATNGTVLDLLLEDENQRPWTYDELALEIGSALVVEDAINNLQAAGLVHKTSDGLVFATRAAIQFELIRS